MLAALHLSHILAYDEDFFKQRENIIWVAAGYLSNGLKTPKETQSQHIFTE